MMIYKVGNKNCIECQYANKVIISDLDVVEINYEPKNEDPNCHYCDHLYDNLNLVKTNSFDK